MTDSRPWHSFRRSLPLAIALILALASSTTSAATAARWISVVEDGVYRISHEELSRVEPIGSVPTRTLALTQGGVQQPIWIDDGGDGTFDDGDALEFIGDHLRGSVGFFSEYSRHNIYRLSFDTENGKRVQEVSSDRRQPTPEVELTVRRHFEQETVMVRFNQARDATERETWFWSRLSFLDAEPFETPLELDDLAPGPARLRLEMRGWSRHRLPRNSTTRQHRIEVSVDEDVVLDGEWDGHETLVLDGELPAGTLEVEGSTLSVRVPERKADDEDNPIVDLSLLNWIELDYPHSGAVSVAQSRVAVGGVGERTVALRAPGADSLVAYDRQGRRWSGRPDGEGEVVLTATVDGSEPELYLVRDDAFLQLAGSAVDRPSSWKETSRQADYLMIAHSSLLDGTERLAAFHRSRGLEVAVVDVQDVYDEFNHGIVHPRAIRDFIGYAYEEWSRPAPRFVLLVGDASWDIDPLDSADEDYADWSYQTREGTRDGFLKNRSTPYSAGSRDRALIPTGSFKNAQGHAASDNYFVALDEGDFKPSLALGRFPVVDPADLDAIVTKTIRYIEEAGVGPWRRRLLWISNEEEHIQKRTDVLAAQQAARGFESAKVYPKKAEASNEMHQERLLEAFASGQLMVHFHGHGGRYIWRTGPTDYRKNRDLFNLDHLDQLEPSVKLPVILSMTCFSAPFDHPLADSIAEKFLRLPDRGAIAVFAASWRNSPAQGLSQDLVAELTKPQSIGQAILAAKQQSHRRDLVEMYNLLGDPAVPVAAPGTELELTLDTSEVDRLQLRVRFPGLEEGFDGHAIIEWQGADGQTIGTEEVAVVGDRLETQLTDQVDDAQAVSVYMWDVVRGIDGIGALQWNSAESPPTETIAGSASR